PVYVFAQFSFYDHGFCRESLKLFQLRLLDCLAFLADDTFIAVAHALALIWLRRIEAADFRSHLSDYLSIRSFNRQLRVFLDRHLDLVGYRINHRMRIAEAEIHILALNGGFETDALDLQLLAETFAHATHHVIHQGAAESVQRLGLGIIALAADHDLAIVDLQACAPGQFPVQLAFWPLNLHLLALDLHLYFRRDHNWLFSNAAHKISLTKRSKSALRRCSSCGPGCHSSRLRTLITPPHPGLRARVGYRSSARTGADRAS